MSGSLSDTPQVGIFLPVGGKGMMGGADPRWRDIQAMARRAEEIGLDFVGVLDHLLFGHWECWTMLSALAASTERIHLASFVTCTGYRNPALLAKMATTLDEISDGRLILGLGAGDSNTEHRAFGYPTDHLVSRMEEAVQIIRPLLRDGQVNFDGHYYRAKTDEFEPRGPRPDGPPVLIGSLGGERMLQLTARYADIWDGALLVTKNTLAGLDEAMTRVDAACEREGRDPRTLQRMVELVVEFPGGNAAAWLENMPPITGSTDEIADLMAAFIERGVTHIMVWIEPNSLAGLDEFAPVLEAFRERVQGA